MKFELTDVAFTYQSRGIVQRKMFERMNLLIKPGELVGVLGEEGEGKSTLLQLMVGLLRPDSGRVSIEEENIWQKRSTISGLRKNIGFAFQFPEQQFLCETVEEELLFTSKNIDPKNANKELLTQPRKALEMFGLDPERMLARSPFSLSLGEARRVALASLFVSAPRALLLDEPTVGLDAAGIRLILSVLRNLTGRNVTMVIVSHDVDFLAELVDRIIVLRNGSIHLDCPAADLLTDPVTMGSLGYAIPEVVQFVRDAGKKGIRLDSNIRTRAQVLNVLQTGEWRKHTPS